MKTSNINSISIMLINIYIQTPIPSQQLCNQDVLWITKWVVNEAEAQALSLHPGHTAGKWVVGIGTRAVRRQCRHAVLPRILSAWHVV